VRGRHRSAFTLLEVLLAMALFGLGITAIMGLLQMSTGLENEGRAHAELALRIEPLIRELQEEVFLLDPSGRIAGIQERRAQPVPGAEDWNYDLLLDPAEENRPVRRAVLRFWRQSPERPVAEVSFLLRRHVPLERRLEAWVR